MAGDTLKLSLKNKTEQNRRGELAKPLGCQVSKNTVLGNAKTL